MEDVFPCLTRPREVRQYLSDIGFSPSKSMGQNFLIDAHMRDLILDASGIHSGERAVEIGPGLGVMTEGLLGRADQSTAIELDARLVEHLQNRFRGVRTLNLLHQDATKTDWGILMNPGPVRVISNLPYSVGSRILYDLAHPDIAPMSITVMVQSDVADRMLASPGGDLYGLLTVRLGWTYKITRVRNVPGNCFLPAPRVGSSVVHLERRPEAPADLKDFQQFEDLTRFAFTKRRKQLKSILKSFGAQYTDLPIDPVRRSETLSLEEWAALSNAITRT